MKFPPCSSRSKATDILYFFHRHYVVNHHVIEILSIVLKITVAKLSKSRLQKYTQTVPDQSIKQMIELNNIYFLSTLFYI